MIKRRPVCRFGARPRAGLVRIRAPRREDAVPAGRTEGGRRARGLLRLCDFSGRACLF